MVRGQPFEARAFLDCCNKKESVSEVGPGGDVSIDARDDLKTHRS